LNQSYQMKQFIKKILHKPIIAKKITRLLVKIHHLSYSYIGSFASAAEGGLHPKHRLINYHQFFVDHISKGETVLDVGCGNGSLLRDVAMKTNAIAVGVDISKDNVKSAKTRLSDLPNVCIMHSDIRDYKDNIHFDTIILSNVLEHMDKRTELLMYLRKQFQPKQVLIRVPMFEREWLVPYKKELGIEWRLDPTHKIEYTEKEFRNEISKAELHIQEIIFRWGEMYTVAVSS